MCIEGKLCKPPMSCVCDTLAGSAPRLHFTFMRLPVILRLRRLFPSNTFTPIVNPSKLSLPSFSSD